MCLDRLPNLIRELDFGTFSCSLLGCEYQPDIVVTAIRRKDDGLVPQARPCGAPGNVHTLGIGGDLALFGGISFEGGIAYDKGNGSVDLYGSFGWGPGVDADIGIVYGQWENMAALNGRFKQWEVGALLFDYSRTYDANGRHVGTSTGVSAGIPLSFMVPSGTGSQAHADGSGYCF